MHIPFGGGPAPLPIAISEGVAIVAIPASGRDGVESGPAGFDSMKEEAVVRC